MQRCSRLAKNAIAIALVCSGCEHTIALGTECPPIGKECIDSTNRPPRPPPVDIPDASEPKPEPDAAPAPVDASVPTPPDASVDEPDASTQPAAPFPGFFNPSFELTAGAPDGGNLSPLSSSVAIDPWIACSGSLSARPEDDLRNSPVGMPSMTDIVVPTHLQTLVSMAFSVGITGGPATLSQKLSEPLVDGQPYAFAVDVIRSGSADARLQVWGSNTPCLSFNELTESEMIAEGQTLQKVCVTFTATANYTHLILVSSPVSGARLFIDNLRPAIDCP
jgi:hypothetical protein